jgi:AcrR family transcriptional regulator
MSRQTLKLPLGRPRSFDTEAAVERAMGVFWSRGYHATALPDLLRAMKLSRGSLYAAFGDKHSLFLRALDRYIADALTRMDNELDTRREPVAGLRAYLAGYVDRTAVPMAVADAYWWPRPWNWPAVILKSIVASGAFSKPWRPGWPMHFPERRQRASWPMVLSLPVPPGFSSVSSRGCAWSARRRRRAPRPKTPLTLFWTAS